MSHGFGIRILKYTLISVGKQGKKDFRLRV